MVPQSESGKTRDRGVWRIPPSSAAQRFLANALASPNRLLLLSASPDVVPVSLHDFIFGSEVYENLDNGWSSHSRGFGQMVDKTVVTPEATSCRHTGSRIALESVEFSI